MTRIAVLSLAWGCLPGCVDICAAAGGTIPHFTGKTTPSWRGRSSLSPGGAFEPGARSAWHSHDKGQLLLARRGTHAHAEAGGAGDHGAGRRRKRLHGRAWSHLARRRGWPGARADQRRLGGETKWMEGVTDAEYSRK